MSLTIRHAKDEDAKALFSIESLSFPKEEGASLKAFEERIKAYPDHFWILEKDGKPISHINGLCTNYDHLTDEMYENTKMHDEKGCYQMIFGVATLPEERGKGYASLIMEKVILDARKDKRKGIILTCKDYMIPFYERFGFINNGLSKSEHGNAKWYEMALSLSLPL